jgi:hypothetical protein
MGLDLGALAEPNTPSMRATPRLSLSPLRSWTSSGAAAAR